MARGASISRSASRRKSHQSHYDAQAYAQLHKRILNGELPQRYVTYVCDKDTSTDPQDTLYCGGLRDRLRGITNAFFYALQNDRAFIMDSRVRRYIPSSGF